MDPRYRTNGVFRFSFAALDIKIFARIKNRTWAQVRLKIADDNDLNTAKEALITMAGFFVSIAEEAARRGGDATTFGILQVWTQYDGRENGSPWGGGSLG